MLKRKRHALQMKGRWESNISVWFPFTYSQKWNCSFETKIIMFSLPVPTLIYLRGIYIYFQDWSAYSAAGKYVDVSWEFINPSQTHECGNWDWDRAIPRTEIHKWDFRCSVGFSLDAQNMLLAIQNNLQRLLFCGAKPFVAVFTLPFKPNIYIYYIVLFYLILDSARWAWLSVIAKTLIYSLCYMYISTSLLVCSDK